LNQWFAGFPLSAFRFSSLLLSITLAPGLFTGRFVDVRRVMGPETNP